MFPFHLLVAFLCLARNCLAATVEVGANGEQIHHQEQLRQPRQVKANFVNALPNSSANLYWAGNDGHVKARGLQMYYGPLEAGGSTVVDAYEGMIFAFTTVGTYERLGEFTLSADRDTYILTEELVNKFTSSFPPDDAKSKAREEHGQTCRALTSSFSEEDESKACTECTRVDGCGYSQVRKECFVSHSIATINTVEECNDLSNVGDVSSKTLDDWLSKAKELQLFGQGSKAQRLAYKCLQRALELAKIKAGEDDKVSQNKALGSIAATLEEQRAKLEAVFDEVDYASLIDSSRHPKLAEIHRDMSSVPRRTMEEAREYILRGEPVVIVDAFDDDEQSSPIPQTWTLEYLNKKIFDRDDVKFNVATDMAYRCCRYFDPQSRSAGAGYPYPFAPTTHLIRDSFKGFVDTVRRASRDNSTDEQLYYLHEIVMNREGKAAVAGGSAPEQLGEDLKATASTLTQLASIEPFFGNFAYAKVWIGQKGVVMPIHHDATDNLYVMAWGRKRAIIGEPGQLDELYRYPNSHPFVGSSQVNLTEPDLVSHPKFRNARLRDVIVGPGDVLYLPAYWWHQFEQPFESTAAVNFWSMDSNGYRNMLHEPLREHHLADTLEESVTRLFGSRAGVVFDVLSKGEGSMFYAKVSQDDLAKAKEALVSATRRWQTETSQLPGSHAKTQVDPASLVQDHLDRTHRNVDMDV